MEFFDVIKKRGSYRGEFTSEKIPRDILKKIVMAGIDAPSGCNRQTTSFVIVDDGGMVEKIAEVLGKPFAQSAAAMILLVADKTPAYGNESFYKEDASAACENILLAITDLGYATVWLDGVLRGGVGEKIGAILGVPPSKTVQILLPVGRAAELFLPNPKQPFADRAWFNRYGDPTR